MRQRPARQFSPAVDPLERKIALDGAVDDAPADPPADIALDGDVVDVITPPKLDLMQRRVDDAIDELVGQSKAIGTITGLVVDARNDTPPGPVFDAYTSLIDKLNDMRDQISEDMAKLSAFNDWLRSIQPTYSSDDNTNNLT